MELEIKKLIVDNGESIINVTKSIHFRSEIESDSAGTIIIDYLITDPGSDVNTSGAKFKVGDQLLDHYLNNEHVIQPEENNIVDQICIVNQNMTEQRWVYFKMIVKENDGTPLDEYSYQTTLNPTSQSTNC